MAKGFFFPSLFVCAARVFAFAVCEPGDLISEFFAVFLVFVGLTHVDKRVKERERSLSKEFNYECTNEINSVKFRANCLSLIGTGAEIKYMTRGICWCGIVQTVGSVRIDGIFWGAFMWGICVMKWNF